MIERFTKSRELVDSVATVMHGHARNVVAAMRGEPHQAARIHRMTSSTYEQLKYEEQQQFHAVAREAITAMTVVSPEWTVIKKDKLAELTGGLRTNYSDELMNAMGNLLDWVGQVHPIFKDAPEVLHAQKLLDYLRTLEPTKKEKSG